LIAVGEEIIVMGFELTDTPISATVILVDHTNTFVQYLLDCCVLAGLR